LMLDIAFSLVQLSIKIAGLFEVFDARHCV